jgi:serine/threonine protein kinase/Tol biopolymer transport system component
MTRYEIVERLGQGSCGTVHKALDVDLERFVAVRVIPAQRLPATEDRWRLQRETSTLAALDHPNICTVYESGETPDGDLFLVSAFCDGETLARRLERGPLRPAVAVELAAQIAAGLARAHERGLIHRNLRPSNVFVAADGQIKIVDFGLPGVGEQTLFSDPESEPVPPAYAAPEQLLGEWIDARSDLWSAGAILAEMVTGRRPTPMQPFGDLRALQPDVPPELDAIVQRAMALDPAGRYPDAEALRQDLRALRSGSSATTPSSPLASNPSIVTTALPSAVPPGPQPRIVGPYRVIERLGGGGMGIVYRAEDTRLGRIVALKFLPPDLTRDLVAKARFQQEARAASAFDHPNICTIYEVGETADGQLYLAMPCYDGETLRRRLESGPLPVDEAVDVAAQVARGLAKAHRQGIVHRDIKPANLIVTSDGVVKILDFGIAKLAGAAALTRTGSTLGTPAYMSPEQMKGQEVDARSDLWSLGVVLYEMLAGRRPFPGDHESVVRQAILSAQPEPLSHVRPEVPPAVQQLVDALLAKDPDKRAPAADEVAATLRALAGGGISTSLLTATRMAGGPRHRGLVIGIALAGLAVLGTVLALRYGGWAEPERPVQPLQPTFTRLTDLEGSETFPSLSPSGELFAYAKSAGGDADIYLQRVGGGNPINLTQDSPLDDTMPAFSPDGSQIAFRSEREGGGIFVMGATGESVRRLTDFGYSPAWSPDGKHLAIAGEGVSDPGVRTSSSRIWVVDVASQQKRQLTATDAVQPSWSPHGWRIAYWGLPNNESRRVLWSVPAGGGAPLPVIQDDNLNWNPVWSPDGRYLYFASNRSGSMNLWRIPIDERSGKPQGEPEPISAPAQWSAMISLSRDGRHIAYASNDSRSNLERVDLDPARLVALGAPVALTRGSRLIRYSSVSPDGLWVAYFDTVPEEDLFLIHPDGTGARQLTHDPAKDRNPVWSPDGSRLLFYSNRGGSYNAWTIHPDGSGLEPVTRKEPVVIPLWSPDGQRIACSAEGKGAALVDLGKPLAERVPQPLPAPPDGGVFFASSWSPDGRALAGAEFAAGAASLRPGIVMYSFAGRTYERLTGRGNEAVWLSDSRHLAYIEDGKVILLDTATRKSRVLLTPPQGSAYTTVSVAPGNRSLFVVRSASEGDIGMVTLP